MNFYQAYYKRQYNDGSRGWRDTAYRPQSLFVIANNYKEAKQKIERCLAKVEIGDYRAVLVSDIHECIGIDMRHGFMDTFDIFPVFEA